MMTPNGPVTIDANDPTQTATAAAATTTTTTSTSGKRLRRGSTVEVATSYYGGDSALASAQLIEWRRRGRRRTSCGGLVASSYLEAIRWGQRQQHRHRLASERKLAFLTAAGDDEQSECLRQLDAQMTPATLRTTPTSQSGSGSRDAGEDEDESGDKQMTGAIPIDHWRDQTSGGPAAAASLPTRGVGPASLVQVGGVCAARRVTPASNRSTCNATSTLSMTSAIDGHDEDDGGGGGGRTLAGSRSYAHDRPAASSSIGGGAAGGKSARAPEPHQELEPDRASPPAGRDEQSTSGRRRRLPAAATAPPSSVANNGNQVCKRDDQDRDNRYLGAGAARTNDEDGDRGGDKLGCGAKTSPSARISNQPNQADGGGDRSRRVQSAINLSERTPPPPPPSSSPTASSHRLVDTLTSLVARIDRAKEELDNLSRFNSEPRNHTKTNQAILLENTAAAAAETKMLSLSELATTTTGGQCRLGPSSLASSPRGTSEESDRSSASSLSSLIDSINGYPDHGNTTNSADQNGDDRNRSQQQNKARNVLTMLENLTRRRDELRSLDKQLFDLMSECLFQLQSPSHNHLLNDQILLNNYNQLMDINRKFTWPGSQEPASDQEAVDLSLGELNKARTTSCKAQPAVGVSGAGGRLSHPKKMRLLGSIDAANEQQTTATTTTTELDANDKPTTLKPLLLLQQPNLIDSGKQHSPDTTTTTSLATTNAPLFAAMQSPPSLVAATPYLLDSQNSGQFDLAGPQLKRFKPAQEPQQQQVFLDHPQQPSGLMMQQQQQQQQHGVQLALEYFQASQGCQPLYQGQLNPQAVQLLSLANQSANCMVDTNRQQANGIYQLTTGYDHANPIGNDPNKQHGYVDIQTAQCMQLPVAAAYTGTSLPTSSPLISSKPLGGVSMNHYEHTTMGSVTSQAMELVQRLPSQGPKQLEQNPIVSQLAPIMQKMSFRCHVCGSGFEDRHRLQQHLSIHLNLHPSWFEEKTIKETMAQYELRRGDYLCGHCKFRFETTAEFDKHMQLHGDKPHQCELCSQDNKFVSFRYFRQLLTHLRSHCFLYSCRFVPECKQTANRKDYLKLHILKHHLNNKLPEQYTISCH